MTIRRSLAVIFPFGVAFSNCQANGIEIVSGSFADLRGATFTTVAGDAVTVSNGGVAVIDNSAAFTSITGSEKSQGENILTGAGIIYNDDADDPSYHRQNILGTVSQSSGVPTGGIVERGSNADGEYVRFADGTQICSRSVAHNMNLSSSQEWNYPAAFIAIPTATFAVEGNSAADLTDWYARNGGAWAAGLTWRTRTPTGAGIVKDGHGPAAGSRKVVLEPRR